MERFTKEIYIKTILMVLPIYTRYLGGTHEKTLLLTVVSDLITVRIDKGKVGTTIMNSEGYPDFKSGENVILFLSEDDGDLANLKEDYYVLTGMIQGKFSLTEESNSVLFRNTLDGYNYRDSFNKMTIQQEIDSI